MLRPTLYVFSKNEEMENSISRYIRYVDIDGKKLEHHFEPEKHAHTYSVLGKITFTLDSESPETLLNTVVILDISDVDHDIALSLNPSVDSDSTGQTLSSLILAYPEVYWIILGASFNKPQPPKDDTYTWDNEHFVEATNMGSVLKLLKRHQDGYRTIFDPSGLRRWIKNKLLPEEGSVHSCREVFKIINNRRKENCAVVIEEELPFTYLNGYTAYRSEYRCYMITSESEMKRELENKSNKFKLSIEDLDIKLSGMSDEEVVEAQNLYKRAEKYKALENITSLDFNEKEFEQSALTVKDICEVIVNDNLIKNVTTIDGLNKLLEIPNFFEILVLQKPNPRFSRDIMISAKITKYYRNTKNALGENQQQTIKILNRLLLEINYPEQTPKYQKTRFIVTGVAKDKERRDYENIFEIIDKPYAGIYDLKKYFTENNGALEGKLPLNKTPNRNAAQPSSSDEINSHSAPNRILAIADFLIGRARKILDDAKSCEGYVLGAVLALEAKELLCGQSMTTALEAVSLQHQLEVKAECSFLGVAHEIEVEPRFEEIESEVNMTIGIPEKSKSTIDKIISIFKKCETRLYAKSYNTQLEIVNNIRGIFNDYEQFDEEERCIIKTRKFRQRLHWHQPWGKWWKSTYSITIEWYLNLLMSTKGYIPWKLGLASLFWILLFAEVLTCCCPAQFSVNSPDFHASEFKQSSALRKLCRETTKNSLGKYIHARINSVNRLNELLQVPNLYDNILQKHPDDKSLVALNTLVNETHEYRNQRYSSLEADAQNTIKKLNRRLLEEKYENITPKHDTSKTEGFSASVFWKSTRLYLLTFLELSHQEELNGKWWLFWISILEIIVAHVHLGIFISYLFQKLARR